MALVEVIGEAEAEPRNALVSDAPATDDSFGLALQSVQDQPLAFTSSFDTESVRETIEDVSTQIEAEEGEEVSEALVETIAETYEDLGTELESADVSQEDDRLGLKEVSDDLERVSDALEDQGSGSGGDSYQIASDMLGRTGDSLEALAEISEADPEEGQALALDAASDFIEVSEALRGTGSPLELLQNANAIVTETFGRIMAAYETIMGIAFLSDFLESPDDTAQQEEVVRQNLDKIAQQEHTRVDTTTKSSIDLSGWKLTLPIDSDNDGEADEIQDDVLADGSTLKSNFPELTGAGNFVQNADGSITMSSQTSELATTPGSKYPRTEFREMLRRGDTDVDTKGPENNWVTSAASAEDQAAAGGVDGQMQATLSVDRVTELGDPDQAGRVIIGQVHAEDDEPVRLYFHKAPGSDTGAIYFAHEPQDGSEEQFHMLIGDKSGQGGADGIALGEAFTYNIDITGTDLTVSVTKADGTTYSEVVDMSKSGYDAPGTYMYFKAGVYSQNNTTPDPSTDYAEARFYSLETAHDGQPLGAPVDPNSVFEPPGQSDTEGGSSTTGPSDSTTPSSGTTPTDGNGSLDPNSSDGSDPSAANQAALEQRFIDLYLALMEKQISFKEAIEPFKTDNQNAGKG